MKNKKRGSYNPEVELAKGAKLEASSYDKTQKIAVIAGKVTVGGSAGVVEISGTATGRHDASIDGTLGIWLSIFRYMRPDGTTDHVAGWNIMATTVAGQSAEAPALDRLLEGKQTQQKAMEALERLPPKERVVLSMRLVDDKSQREIAAVLGLSEGYVSKLLTRAKEQVKREGWEVDDERS